MFLMFFAPRFVFALFGGRVCLFVALCFPFLGWFSGPLALQAHVCARVEVVFAAPCSCARVCFLCEPIAGFSLACLFCGLEEMFPSRLRPQATAICCFK